MHTKSRKLAVLAVAAAITQSACGQPENAAEAAGAREALAQVTDGIEIDPTIPLPPIVLCTSVDPHATVYVGNGYNVPLDSLPYASKSGSGAYFYEGCGRYVVDLYIGDTHPAANYVLSAYGAAHNLPSSSTLTGELPNNALDCGEYRQWQTFYRKNTLGNWETLGSATQKGAWVGNKCELQLVSGSLPALTGITNTDGSGWDVYRVAVAVKLRSSGQEAKVVVDGQRIIY
ncbi:hypothetical protein LY474_23840 [Myxococcus stipitatus]|uniref:hypothetical protein n=1 Tax=Myxococcus stipitatus TaxID=83455 RepID=UPI001F187140|nr:hypothetical protein [Myxococcus stipitatus]MCE9670844.1 hypothetical protein [Myxococcus stipitatus]